MSKKSQIRQVAINEMINLLTVFVRFHEHRLLTKYWMQVEAL